MNESATTFAKSNKEPIGAPMTTATLIVPQCPPAPPISDFGAAAYDKPRPPFYDPAEVRRLWELIVAPGQVVEVRVLNATTIDDRWPQTYFGYFDDVEKLIAALPRIKSASGIYFTPNPLLSAILPRSANRLRKAGRGGTTSDKEVVSRSWLLLDLDAIRPSGVSSSDSEHAAAMERAEWFAPICPSLAGQTRLKLTRATEHISCTEFTFLPPTKN